LAITAARGAQGIGAGVEEGIRQGGELIDEGVRRGRELWNELEGGVDRLRRDLDL
jgi:hypothetical protein